MFHMTLSSDTRFSMRCSALYNNIHSLHWYIATQYRDIQPYIHQIQWNFSLCIYIEREPTGLALVYKVKHPL